MQHHMLSKDDEQSSEDVPVRREDQQKINMFSRLHNKQAILELDFQKKQKEKEDLEEISGELELVELEGEENVPYKIGDAFFTIPILQAQDLIAQATAKIDKHLSTLNSQLVTIKEEMQKLKVTLYSRFGRSINLEM